MAIILPLRSQTGLTLSLEPTESSPSGWAVYESFEQTPPGSSLGTVTGQTSGTEVQVNYLFGAGGSLSRVTSNVIDGTYSWRVLCEGGDTTYFENIIRGTSDTYIDLTGYYSARVTFTVTTNVDYAGGSNPRLYLEVFDGTTSVEDFVEIGTSTGEYVLEVSLSGLDVSSLKFSMGFTNTSAILFGLIYDMDAFEVNDTPSSLTNGFKVWNGTTWTVKPVKWYNGTTWLTKPLKRWNGSSWLPVEY